MKHLIIKITTTLLPLALLACALPKAFAADTGSFPLVLPWDDSTPSVTSMAYLNAAPAGANGFVTSRNGHFYDEKGRRVRFVGVNMVAGANFPDKSTAQKVAARLQKYGVNIVRLHHMDATWARPGIIDAPQPDKQHLSKDALDRLDYFVYELKQHGIYANINLHVSREFGAGDGLPQTDLLHSVVDFDKAVDFFDTRMIALQKDYAQALLTHLNPYTKTRYVEEPAVAVVEINNEDTLVGEAWSGKLDRLPPHYKTELADLWNAWLQRKYGDTTNLRRAWSAADKPFGPNVLQNALFEQGAVRWNVEQNAPPAEAKLSLPDDAEPPSGVKGRVARLTISQLGAQNWHLQFHQAGLDLIEGEPYTVSFWARGDRKRPLPVYAGVDTGDYHHVGPDMTVQLGKTWTHYQSTFTASRPLAGHNRLTFVLGDALGTVDLAGVSLRAGGEYAFPEDVSLSAGGVPLGQPTGNPAGQDWIAFLMDTERAYMDGMRDYVKNTLKTRASVTGSQTLWGGMGGIARETGADFADDHYYWQHPTFPHQGFDNSDFVIQNTPMTRDANGGALAIMARYRMANKPYTVSEYAHPAPSEFRVESLPMIFAFAAVQDWDGVYLFDYQDGNENWDATKLTGFFHADSDPALMAFLPAASLMFRRFDVPFAHRESRLHVGVTDMPGLMAKNGASIEPLWEDQGVSGVDSMDMRLSVMADPPGTPGAKPRKTAQVQTGTGESAAENNGGSAIRWTGQGTDKAVFRVDSPSSKALVGYLGGQTMQVSGWEVQAGTGGNNFAAMTLSALDGKPTEQSRSLLLTSVASVENTGMTWNEARTSLSSWGTGPTLARTPPSTIHITTRATRVTVYALDATGKRATEIPADLRNGVLTFALRPEHKTVWYEIKAG